MKKILSLILILTLLVSLSACAKKESRPEYIVEQLFEAMKQYDFVRMRECLLSEDDIPAEYEIAEDETQQLLFDHMKIWAKHISYELSKPEINGEVARITANISYTDASAVITETISEYINQALEAINGGASDEDMNELMTEILKLKMDTANIIESTKTLTLECVKTGDFWKIKNLPDEMLDVLTGNIISAMQNTAG